MHADRHIYADLDGHLLAEADPAARFLAYAPGDELTPAHQAELAQLQQPADPPVIELPPDPLPGADPGGEKEKPPPADKARAKSATKEA